MTIDAKVLFDLRTVISGGSIALATLNSEKTLNALSLEMVDLLYPQLKQWENDNSIRCVILTGTGAKAFCAGGDVIRVAEEKLTSETVKNSYTLEFFTKEYQLDYLIHTYKKPIIVWAHGIVMGGGMGLLAGGSHRIVTETTYWAMPEITIGLYPDVGGTYFLNRAPKGLGLFMGLTGAAGNAADALFMGLADHMIKQEYFPVLLEQLTQLNWAQFDSADAAINSVLRPLTSKELPESNCWKNYFLLRELVDEEGVVAIAEKILRYETRDPWLQKAQKNLKAGCPTTAHIVYEQLKRGERLTLKECFQLELILSVQCVMHGDFAEGVRALLIDRDKTPHWRYSDIQSVPTQDVLEHFTAPWVGAHPLTDL